MTTPYTLRPNGWRIAGWGSLAALLALPAVAMTLTAEVDWTAIDFLFAALLLGALGIGIELAFRVAGNLWHTGGIALFALLCFMTLWANMAVGIIGDEGAAVNQGFTLGVLGAGLTAAIARLHPKVMRTLGAALALAQPFLGLVAIQAMPGHAVEWGVLAMFALLWSLCAFAFHRSLAPGNP